MARPPSHLQWLQARNGGGVPANVSPYRNPGDGLPHPRGVTPSELARHGTATSLWLSINGDVYDCTAYSKCHPGGLPSILSGGGRDCTQLFKAVHPWVNPGMLLGQPFFVGNLVPEPPPPGAEAAAGGAASASAAVGIEEGAISPPGAGLSGGGSSGGGSGGGKGASAGPARCPVVVLQGSLRPLGEEHQLAAAASASGAPPHLGCHVCSTCADRDFRLALIVRCDAMPHVRGAVEYFHSLAPASFCWVADARGGDAKNILSCITAANLPKPLCVLASADSPAAQQLAVGDGIPVVVVSQGRGPLRSLAGVGFPQPHASLLCTVLSGELSLQWEREWEDAMRAAFYNAQLLFAATLSASGSLS
jgi:hypothetical protein